MDIEALEHHIFAETLDFECHNLVGTLDYSLMNVYSHNDGGRVCPACICRDRRAPPVAASSRLSPCEQGPVFLSLLQEVGGRSPRLPSESSRRRPSGATRARTPARS